MKVSNQARSCVKKKTIYSFYLEFILGWVLSEFLHHTAELGDADVAAAVDVVLEERLFMMIYIL